MKPKKLSKKLGLNKKTIADLNNKEMQDAYGGLDCTCYYTCDDRRSFFYCCNDA